MTKPRLDSDVEVHQYVAETAVRLHGRLGDVSSAIRRSLEEQIPELRGDVAIVELLGTSVESNVDTMLHALRYNIAVERVEAPTAALEYARRLAQHGVPVNALVRAYRLGQRRMNELIFTELRTIEVPEAIRVAVLEAITGAIFEFGFTDSILQMWAAFCDELVHGRSGMQQPFYCVTPEEAHQSHLIFTEALRSHAAWGGLK